MLYIVYVLLGISSASICDMPTFRNHVSVPSSKAGSRLCGVREGEAIYTVAEDGTDTWFRNVGISHIDAGEIPKRTYTIFKSRRKLETYNLCYILSGFGGLEAACWPLVPKFASSHSAEAVGFFRAKKSSARLPSEGK